MIRKFLYPAPPRLHLGPYVSMDVFMKTWTIFKRPRDNRSRRV
ncbi:unnamed protein product [Penicillium roqueforti FM164]|uniref:Genomic scaffold, ProqFM164S02 n=1 Tax=Penicillium roqueforti (strain FM164) TaxID=1365484 RepID=W6Q6G6_PENRF|nr:unnamed protein product [Penicillium roqueforti FM164]